MKVKDLELVNAAPLHIRRSYILGCGGMGTEAVNQFKRVLAERFDTRRFNAIQVLCFDSAQPDYTPSEYCLESYEHMRIYSQDLRTVVEDLPAHPRIAAWFPQEAVDKARQIVRDLPNAAQGAASTRPFGRIGLFEHWQEIYSRLRGIADAPSGLATTLDGETVPVEETDAQHFYVIASLGGGTGTGIFLDIAALLRKLQQDLGREKWQVRAILVLPEILVRDSNIPRNYAPQIMANSYAALKELDHVLHGNRLEVRYGDGRDSVVRIGDDEAIGRLFDRVFLVDAENGSGQACANRDEMARLIGEVLFHLTATEAGRDLERRIPDTTARLFFQEELPKDTHQEALQGIIRERRRCLYSSFGHTTLRIPVRSILDYCACQRALETFEYVAGDQKQAPEAIAGSVDDLMQGTAAELPILEQLGITSAQFDRALDLARHLEALPESEQILQEGVPSDQLRALLTREAWTPGKQGGWEARTRGAADQLRQALIQGETRIDQKTQKAEAIPGRIGAKVDALCACEGPGVVDILLDQIEKEVVKIRAEAEASLVKTRRELELDAKDAEGGGTNKYWRGLESACRDIADLERRGGFLRAWFNRRRVGALIELVLSDLDKLRRRYMTVPRIAEKIRLCDDLIDEVNRQDDVILAARAQGLKAIKDELRARRDQALVACQMGSTPTLRLVAPRLDQLYRRHYLPQVGAQGMPVQMADQLRRNGVAAADGTQLDFEQWGDRPMDVADALYRLCASATEVGGDALVPHRNEPGGRALWALDFDSRFFTDTGTGSDDFDLFSRELLSHAEPYLEYNGYDAPNQPWNRLISGSCRSEPGRWWNRWVKAENSGNAIYPAAPNQVTLLSVRMAFPLFRLGRIKVWKRYYDEYLRMGWPLHLFQSATEWNEPYIPEVDEQDYDVDTLCQESLHRGVVKTHGTGQFIYRHPREEVQSLFRDGEGRDKGLSESELQHTLRRHRILAQEVFEDVVEEIIRTDGRDLEAKIRANAYPLFIRKELEAFLRDCPPAMIRQIVLKT